MVVQIFSFFWCLVGQNLLPRIEFRTVQRTSGLVVKSIPNTNNASEAYAVTTRNNRCLCLKYDRYHTPAPNPEHRKKQQLLVTPFTADVALPTSTVASLPADYQWLLHLLLYSNIPPIPTDKRASMQNRWLYMALSWCK